MEPTITQTETPHSSREHLHRPILITGASDQLGRATVAELLRLGATQVIAATRQPDQLPQLQARGAKCGRRILTNPKRSARPLPGWND